MQLDRHGEVTVLHMNAGKANALNANFLHTFMSLLDDYEASDAGALVISGYGRFFSAGLDLPSMLEYDRSELREFMTTLRRVYLKLFSCATPTVAAINGHAVAGGCVLAYQADYSVMTTGDYKIGLNETQLGIGLPTEVRETLRARVPAASLLPIAVEGELFSPDEALRLGLINELVSPDSLAEAALERARKLAAVPRAAAQHVKEGLVRKVLKDVEASCDADLEGWLDTFYSDEAQARIKAAVEKLAK